MTATMLLAMGVLTPALTVQAADLRALQAYEQTLQAYVELHRAAEAERPAMRPCGSGRIEERRTALANAIRRVRPHAREGAIFKPEMRNALRARIEIALGELDRRTHGLPSWPATEHVPTVVVNELLPWEVESNRGASLFWVLPPLPGQLAYHVVGTDLVLVDIEARLVVDVLRDVLVHSPAHQLGYR